MPEADYPTRDGAGNIIIPSEQSGIKPAAAVPASLLPMAAFAAGGGVLKPQAGGLIAPHALSATTATTAVQVADREVLAPFTLPYDMTIDQIGLWVSTLAASSNAKVTLYAADANGRPTTLLFESGNISTGAANTYQSVAAAFTLAKGVLYWLGVRTSGTPTLRALAAGSSPFLSPTTANTPLQRRVLIRTLAYATPATAWVYDDTQLSNADIPLIALRVA